MRRFLTGFVCLAACADAGSDGPDVVVRDSAGVTIVEHPAPTETTPRWTIDSVATLEIGMLEGPPEYQFEWVAEAQRLDDGTILVADGGASELRFYDASGRHIRSAGRQGEGPGEFRGLGQVWLGAADSIVVYDYQLARASVFSPAGEFARTYTLQQPEGVEFRVRPLILAGGRIVSSPGRSFGVGATAGVTRDTSRLYVHGPEGEVVDSLGRWPMNESFVITDENSMMVTRRAFARGLSLAAAGDRFYVGNSDRWQVEVHDTSGLRRIIRMDVAPRPVDAAAIDSLRADRIDNGEPQWRESTERMLAAMSYPETMPVFGRMLVDAAGHLWVQDYAAEYLERPIDWSVFDPDGRLIARVTVPVRFLITQIGEDWVLGVQRDEMDVQYVRVHRLARPE